MVSPMSRAAGRQRLVDGGFVLDARSLGRRPGTMRAEVRTVVTQDRIGLDLIGVPVGAEVRLDLQLQAVSEGVLVTGAFSAPLRGECGRCLEEFADTLELPITELFAYPDSVTDQTTEDGEVHRLDDDFINLEPVVIDAVGLALPLQPVCSPDCPGLCSECGIRLAIADSDHGHEILDPRWAGLADKLVAEPPSAGLHQADSDHQKEK